MKKSEFIKEVKKLGYVVFDFRVHLEVKKEETIAVVSSERKNHLDIINIDDDLLFDILVDYARTPIEEREEEPKYYWVIANERFSDKGSHYFHFNKGEREFFLSWKHDVTEGYYSQFTEKEFFEIEKELDIVGWFKKGEKVE